ncbi:hypothetical protein RJT34_21971 [Clitoria ternatea]|uniref:DUF4220 domain-containing protein n=1 Tax=Clitoria ternatea TaxID=43366 RepID=A0AAN9IVE1_CLITE
MSIEGHRRLVEIVPNEVQELWDKWEIRGLILISLVSQLILIVLGNRRRYKPNICTRALVWSTYLLADWVAAVAMGAISSNLGEYYKGNHKKFSKYYINPQLLAFWAPFFLMHLGGPDTITAYALEDNELWLRHLVGLLSQTALTLYIIIMSWKGNWLSHLTIAMLIVGIIKYVERTWSLYCGSIQHLRDSFLRTIDTSKKIEQQQESNNDGIENFWQIFVDSIEKNFDNKERRAGDPRNYLRAIYIFVSLFADMVLSPWDITQDRKELHDQGCFSWSTYFTLVNDELKLMYDVFYTKAFANYGIQGLISRLVTLITTIVVLASYSNLSENKEHQVVDQIITYLLLVGALISELSSFFFAVFSRWTRHYFRLRGLATFCCILGFIIDCFFTKPGIHISMGQSSFFTIICNKRLIIKGNFSPVNKLEKLSSVSHRLTSEDVLQKVYKSLFDKSERSLQSNLSGVPGYRSLLLEKNKPIFAREVEFHRTIITWHIVTDLCYHLYDEPSYDFDPRENSKEMSDYMFFLLVKQRQMLPVGAGLITLRDTVIEAKRVFEDINVVPQEDNLGEACRKLLERSTTIPRNEELRMQSTSILLHACDITNELIADAGEYRLRMWDFVEELWVQIISYAGAQCRVDMHAHQLRRGPEFLSHVWLLQAHLGLLDQFQIIPH